MKRHISLFKDHLHLRRPRRRKNLHLSKSTSSKAHNKTQLMAEPLTFMVKMLHLTSKKLHELKILGGDSYAVYFRAEGYNLIGHIWYHLWPGEDSTDCTLRATFNSTKSKVLGHLGFNPKSRPSGCRFWKKRGQIQAPTFICTNKSPEHTKWVSSAEGVTPVQSDLQRCHFEVQS